ncbi:MAG: hypothetical protein ACOYKE_14135, partial [Ferruginibacter sp.]
MMSFILNPTSKQKTVLNRNQLNSSTSFSAKNHTIKLGGISILFKVLPSILLITLAIFMQLMSTAQTTVT